MHTELIKRLLSEWSSQMFSGELRVARLLEEAAYALQVVDNNERNKINAIPALLRPKEEYGK